MGAEVLDVVLLALAALAALVGLFRSARTLGVRPVEGDTVRRCGAEYRVVLGTATVARRGDCRDCLHLRGAVTWWCHSELAVAEHGTSIPGRTGCPFWEEAERASDPPRKTGRLRPDTTVD